MSSVEYQVSSIIHSGPRVPKVFTFPCCTNRDCHCCMIPKALVQEDIFSPILHSVTSPPFGNRPPRGQKWYLRISPVGEAGTLKTIKIRPAKASMISRNKNWGRIIHKMKIHRKGQAEIVGPPNAHCIERYITDSA